MNIEHKISTFSWWGDEIKKQISAIHSHENIDFNEIILQAYYHNNWFTEDNILLALNNICNEFLQSKKLKNWMNNYSEYHNINSESNKTIGITMAGNLPLVGFHDLLCVLMSNHKAMIKLSTKDSILLPYLLQILFKIEPLFTSKILISENLKGADAYIATGSNNSAKYFEYYFGKYPNIIRKNRTSIALLNGNETDEELYLLGTDIFNYFGLGCRNVGKLYITPNVNLQHLMKTFDQFKHLAKHDKYRNNFDYQLTILLMNKTACLANECIILTENKSIFSPLSVLHYEVIDDLSKVNHSIPSHQIQCIIGSDNMPFGKSQIPNLLDYADGIDTMKWLNKLR